MTGAPALPAQPDSLLPVSEHVALLKEEYFQLQKTVETFDERALHIKGWSVTVSLAGMAGTLVAKDLDHRIQALGFALSAVAALAFWLIEYSWKRFQWAFYPRLRILETAFRAGTLPAPLQIRASFGKSLRNRAMRAHWRAFYPFIMLPHAAIALIGAALAAYFWCLP